MLLDIVIPTKNREDKLNNCLNSIFISCKDIEINLYIYFSIKEEYLKYQTLFSGFENVKIQLLDNYRVPNFWNTHLKNTNSDAMMYINDDVVLFEDTIKNVIEEFNLHFPDYDGVIGLNQLNLNEFETVEGAFGVIGKKYSERFPNSQVFCPDYDRFWADFELWQYAKSINKFYFSRKAQLIHNHPCINRKFEDETHRDVRKYLSKDKQTFQKRKSLNFLWGKDLTLINT